MTKSPFADFEKCGTSVKSKDAGSRVPHALADHSRTLTTLTKMIAENHVTRTPTNRRPNSARGRLNVVDFPQPWRKSLPRDLSIRSTTALPGRGFDCHQFPLARRY